MSTSSGVTGYPSYLPTSRAMRAGYPSLPGAGYLSLSSELRAACSLLPSSAASTPHTSRVMRAGYPSLPGAGYLSLSSELRATSLPPSLSYLHTSRAMRAGYPSLPGAGYLSLSSELRATSLSPNYLYFSVVQQVTSSVNFHLIFLKGV